MLRHKNNRKRAEKSKFYYQANDTR